MNPNNPETNTPPPTPQTPAEAPAATETPAYAPEPVQPVASSFPETAQPAVTPIMTTAGTQPDAPVHTSHLKSVFLKVLIGCLIASAVVAVVAILAGGLGDIGGKALTTIVIVALHALLALGFLNMDGTHDEAGDLRVFTNVVFGILVLSFITATMGIWDIIPGETAWKMYLCYGVLIIAVLHGEVLARALNHQTVTNNTIYANFITMALVVGMLWIWILAPDLVEAMNPYFLRILAASAVVDGTLTLTAIILDRLYLSKQPKSVAEASVVTPAQRKSPSLFVIIVIGLIGLQMLPALIFAALDLF